MSLFKALREKTDEIEAVLRRLDEVLERQEENLIQLQVQMHLDGLLATDYPSWMKLELCSM